MNRLLDKCLCERYPKIFAHRNDPPQVTAMCWGFSCGDGWYKIIDALCRSLQWDTDVNGYPQVVADQVKEKFGTLSFYYHTEKNKKSLDKINYNEEARQYGIIEGKIRFAEEMSAHVCEECGEYGSKIKTKTGWIKTLCLECEEEPDGDKKEN